MGEESRRARRVLSGLVRVGIVTDLDAAGCRARVKYQSENMTSGWLRVLQHRGAALKIEAEANHSHSTGDGSTGGAGGHGHDGSSLGEWMPEINSVVLCLYLPMEDGDGYILGGV